MRLRYGISDPVYVTYVLVLKFNERIGTFLSPGGCHMVRSTIEFHDNDLYKFFVENNIQFEQE